MDQEDDIFAQVTVELEIDFYEGVAKNLIWAGVVPPPPPKTRKAYRDCRRNFIDGAKKNTADIYSRQLTQLPITQSGENINTGSISSKDAFSNP